MYTFKFAAVCRTDKKTHIHHLSAVAATEREARLHFAKTFILFFSARIPVAGGVA